MAWIFTECIFLDAHLAGQKYNITSFNRCIYALFQSQWVLLRKQGCSSGAGRFRARLPVAVAGARASPAWHTTSSTVHVLLAAPRGNAQNGTYANAIKYKFRLSSARMIQFQTELGQFYNISVFIFDRRIRFDDVDRPSSLSHKVFDMVSLGGETGERSRRSHQVFGGGMSQQRGGVARDRLQRAHHCRSRPACSRRYFYQTRRRWVSILDTFILLGLKLYR